MMEDGVIDSFAVYNIAGDLEEEFDIEIASKSVTAESFRNKEAIIALVKEFYDRGE